MTWGYYQVLDPLTRNGTTYEPGGATLPSFEDGHPEIALLQSQGVLGERTGDAPDPIDEATAGLPDPGVMPGDGLLHRKDGKYSIKDKLAGEFET